MLKIVNVLAFSIVILKWNTHIHTNYILPRYFISVTANSHLFCESVHERQIESRKGTDKTLWIFWTLWERERVG